LADVSYYAIYDVISYTFLRNPEIGSGVQLVVWRLMPRSLAIFISRVQIDLGLGLEIARMGPLEARLDHASDPPIGIAERSLTVSLS
jgi:hypothetical protein